jgi:F-type H+-transporting ATPase subunit delta
VLDNVYRDMILITEVCSMKDVRELLASPVATPSKKRDILHKIFGSDLEPITLSLLDLVVKNGRENFLPAIARVFIKETKEHKGITESALTTAVKVSPQIMKQISEMISLNFKMKVDMKEIIEPGIIGGFILRIEDNYIDASVKNKLRKIEKALKDTTLTA